MTGDNHRQDMKTSTTVGGQPASSNIINERQLNAAADLNAGPTPIAGQLAEHEPAASGASSSTNRRQHEALFASIPQSGLKCDILFLVIKNRIQEEPEYVKRLRVVFQFNILRGNQPACTWTSDTRTSVEGDVYRSAPRAGLKPDCVLTVDDDDFVKIMVGKLNPQRAFMLSKFKIKGNIMLLQKLHALWFDLRRKGKTPELDLIQEIMVNEPLLAGLKSEAMAIEIVQRIVKLPALVAQQMNANIQLDILQQGELITQYWISMKPNRKPEFRRLYNARAFGSSADQADSNSQQQQQQQQHQQPLKSDLILTLEDDDLVLIIYGIFKVAQAIELGKLKVHGDLMVLDRARTLFEQPPLMAKL